MTCTDISACEAIFEAGEGHRLTTPTTLFRSSSMSFFPKLKDLKSSHLALLQVSASPWLSCQSVSHRSTNKSWTSQSEGKYYLLGWLLTHYKNISG